MTYLQRFRDTFLLLCIDYCSTATPVLEHNKMSIMNDHSHTVSVVKRRCTDLRLDSHVDRMFETRDDQHQCKNNKNTKNSRIAARSKQESATTPRSLVILHISESQPDLWLPLRNTASEFCNGVSFSDKRNDMATRRLEIFYDIFNRFYTTPCVLDSMVCSRKVTCM